VGLDPVDERVACPPIEGLAEEFRDRGIGVHGRERIAIRVAPAAKQKASRADLDDRRHRTIFSHCVGILGW
jgi:hypothetical protein